MCLSSLALIRGCTSISSNDSRMTPTFRSSSTDESLSDGVNRPNPSMLLSAEEANGAES
jgi:hypothetical protein